MLLYYCTLRVKNINSLLFTTCNCITNCDAFHFNLTTIFCISRLTVTCIKLLLTYLLTYLLTCLMNNEDEFNKISTLHHPWLTTHSRPCSQRCSPGSDVSPRRPSYVATSTHGEDSVRRDADRRERRRPTVDHRARGHPTLHRSLGPNWLFVSDHHSTWHRARRSDNERRKN